MKQSGTVLVFKQGLTQAEIKAALEKLADVLAYSPTVHTFNPDHGGPVFYIP